MVYEMIVGLVIALVGASHIFETRATNWLKAGFDKLYARASKRTSRAMRVSLGWPTFLAGILIALPLPQRYDLVIAAVLVIFALVYHFGKDRGYDEITSDFDGEAKDVTPRANSHTSTTKPAA